VNIGVQGGTVMCLKWEFKENKWWEINYHGVGICIEPRPAYCDRGNWVAKVFEPGLLYLDSSDGWPRYYFNLTRAKLEVEDFLRRRKHQMQA